MRPQITAVNLTVAAGLLGLYAVVWLGFDRLAFPVQRDEIHFWPTALRFSESWLPSVALLRDYQDLNTPLPFIVWGSLEHLFGGGIAVGRHFNYLLCLGIALLIAWQPRGREWHGALCAAGLVAFPYFIGTATHLYTDMLAAFLVVVGVALHGRGRYFAAALALAAAVSTRQFMVAFPLGLLAYELFSWRHTGVRPTAALAGAALGISALAGWILFFGDFAPARELRAQAIATASIAVAHPRYALFFLAFIGLYFALAELLLFGGAEALRKRMGWPEIAAAAVLLAAFAAFPPIANQAPFPTFGFTDAAFRYWLPDFWRMVLYYLLAVLAVTRLIREPMAFALLCANAAILTKANTAWEKYAIPLLAVLWYLKSRGEISGAERTGHRIMDGAAG